ncbi:MAG: hypothetical protein ACRDTT_25315 [Pseudonocardiaceae bacterium]
MAFDQLADDEPVVLHLLTLCAQLAPEPILFTLFTAHSDALPTSGLTAVVGDPWRSLASPGCCAPGHWPG